MEYFEKVDDFHAQRFDDPETWENNLEYDMMNSEWFVNKVRSCMVYAQNVYAALCNNEFQKLEVISVLKNQTWSCSWRSAGGIVAELRNEGDYLDWYCSGVRRTPEEEDGGSKTGYMFEGEVAEELSEDLKKLGWIVVDNHSD